MENKLPEVAKNEAAGDTKKAKSETAEVGTKKVAPETVEVGAKVLKGSFWVIAAIHIAVFTAIGAATGQWRLLVIFLIGFVLTLAAYAGLKYYLAQRKS